ncbi:MAG: glycosyltransferase [Erythrobacter sp.]|uniref:glycosyltransferase n=1 Tax=Erythrobacter sp. TaxID=1042 RepID=UPI003A869748
MVRQDRATLEDLEANAVVTKADMPFSVVIPVYNEASGLAERARSVVSGLPHGCEVVFVCNGCTDDSQAILEREVSNEATILACAKGKAHAIRLGEQHCSIFPRFYVDSDVWISGDGLARLSACLNDRTLLVSPRIRFDVTDASPAAAALSRFWLALPHGQSSAYHHVLGIGKALRSRWGEFPDLIADDTFIESLAKDEEKAIIDTVFVTTSPPKSWWAWVQVRVRWQQGINQLVRARHRPPQSQGQTRAILKKAIQPRWALIAVLYISSVVLARILARSGLFPESAWITDATSRQS